MAIAVTPALFLFRSARADLVNLRKFEIICTGASSFTWSIRRNCAETLDISDRSGACHRRCDRPPSDRSCDWCEQSHIYRRQGHPVCKRQFDFIARLSEF